MHAGDIADPSFMRLPLLVLSCALLTGALCSCTNDRTEGLITTYDGHFVVGTAEVVSDDLSHRWAALARDSAGENWGATVTIHGTPEFNLVKPEEFGWRTLPIDLVLVPPRGVTGEDAAVQRATAAVKSAANYRVQLGHEPQITTSVMKTGELPPGATLYTTVAGDTMASIAAAFYGSTQYWRRVADANRGVEIGDLKPGIELVIPAKP